MSKKIKFILILSFIFLIGMGVFEYIALRNKDEINLGYLKTAQASNNYISNIAYYKDTDGYLRLKFHVDTSFCARTPFYWDYMGNQYYDAGYTAPLVLSDNDCSTSILKDAECFTAGNTYTLFTCFGSAKMTLAATSSFWIKNIGWYDYPAGICEGKRCIFTPTWYDTESYYFTEYPTITVDYPADLAEIAGPFTITGNNHIFRNP